MASDDGDLAGEGAASASAAPIARVRIARWAPADAELERALERALATGRVAGGEELKPGRVWRLGGAVVKLYPPRAAWRDRLRPPPAVRAARAAARVGEGRTPRVLAAAWTHGGAGARASALATEHVAGRDLGRALADGDARALDALPVFLADLHARSIHHGDFHPWQLVWNGERWLLLDLDGIRHRLRALARERLEREAWARLCFYAHGFVSPEAGARIEGLHESYLRLRRPHRARVVAERAREWERVRSLADAFGRSRAPGAPTGARDGIASRP